MMWECEVCESENDLDQDAEEGQIIECMDCGIEYEIVSISPLRLEQLDAGVADGEPEESPAGDEADWEE